jgi:hypothetical protein
MSTPLRLILFAGIFCLSATAVNGEATFDEMLRPLIPLRGDGKSTVVNCPWDKRLTVRLSIKAPAAVLSCQDGGPDVLVELER